MVRYILCVNKNNKGGIPAMKSRNQLIQSIISMKVRQQVENCMQPGTVENIFTDSFNKEFSRIINNALKEEAAQFLARKPYERQESCVHRNGYKNTVILGLDGPVSLKRPVVRKGSIKLPLLQSLKNAGTNLIHALASAFWLKGASTRNTATILREALGAKISASGVSQITNALAPGLQEWENRKIPSDILYVFLDAFYLPVHWRATKDIQQGFTVKQAVLCALGVDSKGVTHVIGHLLGDRESADSWGLMLEKLLERGLDRSQIRLVISDEHKGIIAAVEQRLGCSHQYCVFHKMKNVRLMIPTRDRKEFMVDFHNVFWADSRDDATRAAGVMEGKWSARYPRAVEATLRNLEHFLMFMNEPKERWRALRTSNRIERYIGETRRRLRPAGTIHSELELTKILWSVSEAQERGWKTRRAFRSAKEVNPAYVA
jgi:transposase-like protein